MNIDDALNELGSQIGLSSLAVNDAGLCRVVFDEVLTVDFEAMDDGRILHLSSPVLPFDPEVQGEDLMAKLLEANFLGVATGGAHFSTSDDEILLERSLDIQLMDFTGFTQAVESFVNHLEGWRAKLDTEFNGAEMPSEAVPSFQLRA